MTKEKRKNCPHCGRSYEDGYGELTIVERGRTFGGKNLQIYGKEDRTFRACRQCFQFYSGLINLMDRARFDAFQAGWDYGKKEKQ